LLAVALRIKTPALSEDLRAGGLSPRIAALTGAGTTLIALAGAVARAAAALLARALAAFRIADWSRNGLLQRRAGVVGDRLQRIVDFDRSGHWDLRDVEGLLLDVFEGGRRRVFGLVRLLALLAEDILGACPLFGRPLGSRIAAPAAAFKAGAAPFELDDIHRNRPGLRLPPLRQKHRRQRQNADHEAMQHKRHDARQRRLVVRRITLPETLFRRNERGGVRFGGRRLCHRCPHNLTYPSLSEYTTGEIWFVTIALAGRLQLRCGRQRPRVDGEPPVRTGQESRT